MKNLLKMQITNMFHNKLFYICLGISVTLQILFNAFDLISMPSSLKAMPQAIGIISGGLDLLCIIFIALFSCNDFNDGTTKNIIARGYTKNELLLSKYVISALGTFIIILSLALVMFISYLKNGIGYESSMLLIIINSIIKIGAFVVFYSTMSFLLEKNSTAILSCLFVPTIITSVLRIVDSKLNVHISNYWIENLSNKFISNPSLSKFIPATLGYLAYIIIIVIVAIQILKKKEIK